MTQRTNLLPTQARLHELFEYRSAEGAFIRRSTGNSAGTLKPDGYRYIGVDGKVFSAHRLVWMYIKGTEPIEVDHINGIRSDNRVVNLRSVTRAENAQNRRKSPRNQSGFTGVSRHRGKWQAQIGVNGKLQHLGIWSTPDAAHAAYTEAKTRLHLFTSSATSAARCHR